jgi:hypothetical protein
MVDKFNMSQACHNWKTHWTSHRDTVEELMLLNPSEAGIRRKSVERNCVYSTLLWREKLKNKEWK